VTTLIWDIEADALAGFINYVESQTGPGSGSWVSSVHITPVGGSNFKVIATTSSYPYLENKVKEWIKKNNHSNATLQAIAAERSECAKIAKGKAEKWANTHSGECPHPTDVAEGIEAAIRARGQT
jgi:hypothetical protein